MSDQRMSKKGVAVVVVAFTIASLGLGCLKMETRLTVLQNGSILGTAIIAVQEMYWNETEISNLTSLDLQNATVWSEGGWTYGQTPETIVPEEDIDVTMTRYAGYTEYALVANLSDFQETGEEEGLNLSDPFTQMMLQTMTLNFTVKMPGQISDSNAHRVEGSTALWFFNGATIQTVDKIYVKSRSSIPEGLLLQLAAVPLLLGLARLRRRPRSG